MGKGEVNLKLVEHFFLLSHNGTHEDIKVKIMIQMIKKLGKTFGLPIWTLYIQKF